MINVLQRLAELDGANPNVAQAKPKVSPDAAVEAIQKTLSEELSVESLRYLSGVKQSLEECGMWPGQQMGMMPGEPQTMEAMGTPPAPSIPASFSINATASTGDEVAGMLTQIMNLAGVKPVGPQDMPLDKPHTTVSTVPPMGGNDEMKKMLDIMNEPRGPGDNAPPETLDQPEDEGTMGTMAGAGIGAALGGPLGAAVGGVAGDSMTDSNPEDEEMGDTGEVDIAGVGGGLAAAAIHDGDPEEVAAGMEAGKEASGSGMTTDAKEDMRKLMDMISNSTYDNAGADSNEIAGPGTNSATPPSYNPNDGGRGDRMDGNMPKAHMTAEDLVTSKLFSDYEKFVTEGKEKCCCDDKGEDKCPVHGKMDESKERTMSRAAKGIMKYGEKGMKALADAGKKGKDLEPVRAKYNKYD